MPLERGTPTQEGIALSMEGIVQGTRKLIENEHNTYTKTQIKAIYKEMAKNFNRLNKRLKDPVNDMATTLVSQGYET